MTQVAVAMDRMLRHDASRTVLLYETEGIQRLCTFLASENEVLAHVADVVVRTAMDWDRELGRKSIWRVVQSARFRAHNREWVAAAAASAAAGRGVGGYVRGGDGARRHAAAAAEDSVGDESGWTDEPSPERRPGESARGEYGPDDGAVESGLGTGGEYSPGAGRGWTDDADADDDAVAHAAASGMFWGQRS